MTGFSEEPAAPFGAKLDKAAFFAWLKTREGGRFELKDGSIVMHAGSTRRHAQISVSFASHLRAHLPPVDYAVTVADFAVEIGADIRYPDVLVEPAGNSAPDAMSTTSPVLVVEVLSPSSAGRDLNIKLAEYASLPSLQCYIVASQDEAMVWVWQRDADTHEFPSVGVELAGARAAIEIRALDIALSLGDIYRGIVPAQARVFPG